MRVDDYFYGWGLEDVVDDDDDGDYDVVVGGGGDGEMQFMHV